MEMEASSLPKGTAPPAPQAIAYPIATTGTTGGSILYLYRKAPSPPPVDPGAPAISSLRMPPELPISMQRGVKSKPKTASSSTKPSICLGP